MYKMLINNGKKVDKTKIYRNILVFLNQEISIKYEHQG